MRKNDASHLLLNRRQAAASCGIGLRTWDRMNAAGMVGPKPCKLGGTLVWNAEELAEWARYAGNGRLPDRLSWQQMRRQRRE